MRVCISGGFDPIHIGHISLIKDAAKYGDLTVILNSDAWLMRKKGYVFMSWGHRAEIIRNIKGVVDVVPVDDSDGTVVEALERIKPDCFANGGDRMQENTPEIIVCTQLGITPLFGIGGTKLASSSALVKEVTNV